MNASDQEIVVQQDGALVQVTLNRPGALNALTLEMIRILAACLRDWEQDDSVKAIVFKGAGDRAFCAGGDVKATYNTGMAYRRGRADSSVTTVFYGEEYRLNRQLFHYGKPLIALMDGITMGGGYGVAGPCDYRVATEKTVFAMPEVAIGFFPDVGSVYFLNRCPGAAGTYLGVTGNRLGAADMLHGGLASHYAPSAKMENLAAALQDAAGQPEPDKAIQDVLASFTAKPEGAAMLQDHKNEIDACFSADSVIGIIERLRGQNTDWTNEQADIIESRSPTSLKVTLEHLNRSREMAFDEIIAADFTLAQHFMNGHDFYEGVRAVLIDKDHRPQWDPARLADVTPDLVLDYFGKTGLTLEDVAA